MPATEKSLYEVGSLVRLRGREWVVIPSDGGDVIRLRPLSGREEETIGVHRLLEESLLKPATFPDPDPTLAGDYVGGKLLRNAARLSLRSGAGPFRSLGRLSVRPRPYQFVPLIMALRLDTVRLFIADDVGIGKTIEAGMIVRELLDRGDAQRLCVLCPPHLCEQWQNELAEKFHIHAMVIRTSTIAKLERSVPLGSSSLYRHYPHTIVSIDFAKSDRRRYQFLADCADLVVVDEVHSAAQPRFGSSKEQQQRHELLREIAKDPARQLILLSATPHSGVEDSFRSLLGLLKEDYGGLDLKNLTENQRRGLAKHLVQRRRADVAKWPLGDTPFPTRVPPFEETYPLTDEYGKLYRDVLEFTRETVQTPGLKENRRRVRYWAALALLRCLMSSPAAALRAFEARTADPKSLPEDEQAVAATEELRTREIFDPINEGGVLDSVPEPAIELGNADLATGDRSKLREFGKRAQAILDSGKDPKIEKTAQIIRSMVESGYHPIIFCRFVATAKYVADQLSERLKARFPNIHVIAVTGETGDDEAREEAVKSLADSEKRVLVATDCLSEGVNLQGSFDAVLHYDLPWNPNRLEQRDGRVDRFGQPKKEIRSVVLFSPDNPIDRVVLQVLIRKVREIYSSLGIRVSFASDTESVAQALVESVLQGKSKDASQLGFEFLESDTAKQFTLGLELDAKREEESRTRFAQHSIQPAEVAQEIEATDTVLGDPDAVRNFVLNAAQRLGLNVSIKGKYYLLDVGQLPEELRQKLGWQKPIKMVFDSPPPQDVENGVVIGRNHLFTVHLSEKITGMAFRPKASEDNFRCGAAYTSATKSRTVILMLRVRYILSRRGQQDQFAEEVVTTGYKAEGSNLNWYPANDPSLLALLESAEVTGNITTNEKQQRLQRALEEVRTSKPELQRIADSRGDELEAAHDRLREQIGGRAVKAKAYPPDILGIHVLLPGGAAQ
jgi:superfamily II DNA or RNA helicase